jgi:uncharacterized OB-fold protein
MADYKKPLPVPNVFTQAYWDGARRRQLVIMRCPACSHYVHPPLSTCPRCGSEEMRPTPVSGRGVIYSYSIMGQIGNPGFEQELPYAVVIVELAEQKGLFTVSNLLDCPIGRVAIGMPVEVTFQDVTPEVTLPQFRPAGAGGKGARR